MSHNPSQIICTLCGDVCIPTGFVNLQGRHFQCADCKDISVVKIDLGKGETEMTEKIVSANVTAHDELSSGPGGLIYKQMALVMRDINAIVKTKQGTVNYKFRSIEDVMNAVHPILAEHEVFIVPCQVTQLKNETFKTSATPPKNFFQAILTQAYRFYTTDGSWIWAEVCAESIDYSDKATQQADSYCYKEVILKTFCIPTVDLQDDGDGKQPDRNDTEKTTTTSKKTSKKTETTPKANEPTTEPNGVIEAAQAVAGADLVTPAAWGSIRDQLDQFELTAEQFHDWTIKTLRENNLIVPDALDNLQKTSAGILWKVAAYSNKNGQLFYKFEA